MPEQTFASRLSLVGIVACILGLGLRLDAGSTWPSWRGPHRDGRVAGDTPWPTSLEDDTWQLSWQVELGPSYSGPIVGANRIFVTETVDNSHERVTALERSTGQVLWQSRWEGAMSVPSFARKNGSWIRSTPSYDGERLYVAGMRDVLTCLNTKTGTVLWRADFPELYGTALPSFGFVCSPLVLDDAVYVQAGGSFVSVNKFTGKPVWRSLVDGGGMGGSAFSSPVVAELGDRKQLLVQTRTRLAGVAPEDGEVLWSQDVPAFRGMNILTPTPLGNQIFTSTYGGGTFLYELKREGDSFSSEPVWKEEAQGYMSSPIVVGDYAYLHLRNKRMTCFAWKTGARKWTTSRRFGDYMSMVVQSDQILALDQGGELHLMRANPQEFELLGSRRVSNETTYSHLAVCDSQVIVRSLNSIASYHWKTESPSAKREKS